MGRAPCCSKVGLHKGPWTPREDTLLTNYIQAHGEGHWRALPIKAGLLRCGKSCRLRWMNYLRPDIKRGNITPDEDDLIIRMHTLLGNRWSLIAGRLPGRTDNEIKNYWNTHLSKCVRSQGTDPTTHDKRPDQPQPDQPITKTRKRKNSKTTNTTTKKSNTKRKGKSVVQEQPKVHLPKPIRFNSLPLPINDSFDVSASSSQGREGGSRGVGSFGAEHGSVEVPAGSSLNDIVNNVHNSNKNENTIDINGVSFLVGDDIVDHDLVNGSALECYSMMPTTNLEKLYEDYWQLLKMDDEQAQMLDSFAESLLV